MCEARHCCANAWFIDCRAKPMPDIFVPIHYTSNRTSQVIVCNHTSLNFMDVAPHSDTDSGAAFSVGVAATTGSGAHVEYDVDVGARCTALVVYQPPRRHDENDDLTTHEHGSLSLSLFVTPPAQDLVDLGGGVDLRETTILLTGDDGRSRDLPRIVTID